MNDDTMIIPAGNEHLTAEAWFANLNSAMQRRVLEVIGSDEDMAHVLRYFPLPFRAGRTWRYPIKGEVPDGLWTPAQLAAIRAHVASGPPLKKPRGGKPPWTDITLEENERKAPAGRQKPAPVRARGRHWQAAADPGPEPYLTEDDFAVCAEFFAVWAEGAGILADAGDPVREFAAMAFAAGFGAGGAHMARKTGLRP